MLSLSHFQMGVVQGRTNRLQESFGSAGECHSAGQASVQVIAGEGELVFAGGALKLGAYQTERPFYCRLPAGVEHRVEKQLTVSVKRTTVGPLFDGDGDHAKASAGWRMVRVGEEAFQAVGQVVDVRRQDIETLKAEVRSTKRKRIRLSTHENARALLHEMFVIYTQDTYIQPNKHYAKDESFHILEGECDFILFTEAGDVEEILPMGPIGSGKAFYVRVPPERWHTVVIRSELLVVSEATPGPYFRDHTAWAPWAAPQAQDFKRGIR